MNLFSVSALRFGARPVAFSQGVRNRLFAVASALLLTSQVQAQGLWSDESGAPKDSTQYHQVYVGTNVGSFSGSATTTPFDISSWRTTSGTRVENNANLEARLRAGSTTFNANLLAIGGVTVGYQHLLLPKISLIAEANYMQGSNGYSFVLYGGAAYKLWESEKLTVSAVGKLGFGRQVIFHEVLQSFSADIPSTTNPGTTINNNYGRVVFTNAGTFIDGDRVYMNMLGVQYQLAAAADYSLGKHLFLKGQVGLQGATLGLDNITIEGRTSNRGDNFRLLPAYTYEVRPDNASIVKTDLSRDAAKPSLNASLFGFYVGAGVGVRF